MERFIQQIRRMMTNISNTYLILNNYIIYIILVAYSYFCIQRQDNTKAQDILF